MSKLPFDIWYHIASYADRGDLLQLALVSKDAVGATRRVLAREVTLYGSQRDGSQAILDYLVRTGLSRCVKKLAFRGFDMRMQVPEISFASMPCLSSLAVVYRTPVPNSQQRRSKDKLSQQNFLLFRGTFANITELDISISTRCRDFVAYAEIARLRFPNLLKLRIGPGHKDLLDINYPAKKDAIAGVTVFLAVHPTIVSLVLGHTAYQQRLERPYDVFIPIRADLISDTFLPNLRSLDAHPKHIYALARAHAPGLAALQTLSISEKRYQNLDEVLTEMWAAIGCYNSSRQHGPCSVQHFHLKLRKIRRFVKHEPIFLTRPMASMVKRFPHLQSWSGDLPARDKTLFRTIPRFRELRELTCRMGYSPLGRCRVRELANRCPCLEKVTCRISGVCFQISRDETDGVVQISTDQGYDVHSDEEENTKPIYLSSDSDDGIPRSAVDDDGSSSGSDSSDSDAPCRHDCEKCNKDRLNMSSDDEEEEHPEYPDDSTTDANSVWSSEEEEESDHEGQNSDVDN